jgi:hypothetical protein
MTHCNIPHSMPAHLHDRCSISHSRPPPSVLKAFHTAWTRLCSIPHSMPLALHVCVAALRTACLHPYMSCCSIPNSMPLPPHIWWSQILHSLALPLHSVSQHAPALTFVYCNNPHSSPLFPHVRTTPPASIPHVCAAASHTACI